MKNQPSRALPTPPLAFMSEDELMDETMAFKSESEHLFGNAQRALAAGLAPFRNDPDAFMHFVRRARALRDELAERLLASASLRDSGATGAILLQPASLEGDDELLDEAESPLSVATAELLDRWALAIAQMLAALNEEAYREERTPNAEPPMSLQHYSAWSRQATAIEEELGRRWTEEQREMLH
jgi:hypothetical protein